MDIATLQAADSASIHVKSATGEPLYDGDKPVLIVIHGPGSRAFGAVEARQSSRALKRMQENDNKLTAPTAEERVAETAEDLADITIKFEGLSSGDLAGRQLFEAVYRDPKLGYITRQVSKALNDWGNFRPA